MLIVFIRTIILYFLVIFILRLMGKRQIGELQPYDLVITIMLSDLALMPMEDTRLPLLLGIVPMLTLLLIKLALSQIQLKSQLARKIIDGAPEVLIYKSKINYNSLKKQQINIDELMEAIRLAGYFDLEEIQYAILETNGKISILPRTLYEDPIVNRFKIDFPNRDAQKSIDTDITKHSLNYENLSDKVKTISGNESPNDIFLPKVVIVDGEINKNSLTKLNKDELWIKNLLKEHHIDDIKLVLIALYDTRGKFKYQLYDEYEETLQNELKGDKK